MGKLAKLAGALKKAADIPDQVMIDGVVRATRNSKGQLIHPTSEGIENFWRWYGDSPMDDAGRPIVQYHGTASNVKKFNPFPLSSKHSADFGVRLGGTFTTPNPNIASEYAEGAGRVIKDDLGPKEYFKYSGSNVMPVYVRTENPWILDKTGQKVSLYTIHDDINRRVIGYNPDGTVKFSGPPPEGGHDSILIRNWQDMGPVDYDQYRITDPTSIKSATANTGRFDPNKEDITGFVDPRLLAPIAVGAGALMGAQAYDFGTPEYDAKIQEFRNRRAAKSQIWKELKEAGATIASAIPSSIVSDAYRIGGYLSPVTSLDETEQGAESVQNALMYTPEGDNRYLNEFARQVQQFEKDVQPMVNAWKQTPIYKGYKQLPERAQRLIQTASEYAF